MPHVTFHAPVSRHLSGSTSPTSAGSSGIGVFADLKFFRSGPFAAVGWLSCLGNCEAAGYMVYERCMGKKHKVKTRATQRRISHPCMNLMNWAFDCPVWRQGLLNSFSCPGTPAAGDVGPNGDVATVHRGDSIIHF